MFLQRKVKVLELASVLAGPSVGQFFAELGADVIKVENLRTGGDVTRTWKLKGEQTDSRSAYFCSVNWGKRSIALDLAVVEGQSIVHELAKTSDIVVASYKPGDAAKLRVDYESLSALNPKIIYGEITGYGSNNSRVGYDAIIQAESGFMSLNGEPSGPSLKMPVALMDVLAGHHLKEAILVALLNKELSGNGSHVQVSLIQAAVASLVNQATNYLVAHHLPQKQGSSHPNIAPYGDVFRTKDNKELILAVGTDRQFADLCSILNLDHLSFSPEFSTNKERVKNREKLFEELQRVIENRTGEELQKHLNQRKVPAGIIQNLEEVFKMPEVNGILLNSGAFSGIKSFVGHSHEHKTSHFLPPPKYGEHTDFILQESLKYSSETAKSLREKGVIA